MENNLINFINELPNNINIIKKEVEKIEEIYKKEEEEKALKEKLCYLDENLHKYNSIFDDLKIPEKNIILDIQINPKYISRLKEFEKQYIQEYKDLYNKDDKETIIIWKIPYKNNNKKENFKIEYEKKHVEKFSEKSNYLYFKIDDLNDEFKNKFSVFVNFNNKKNYIKRLENKNEDFKECKAQEYIFFDKSEKITLTKYSLIQNEELIKKTIKEKIIKHIKYTKISFKGKKH